MPRGTGVGSVRRFRRDVLRAVARSSSHAGLRGHVVGAGGQRSMCAAGGSGSVIDRSTDLWLPKNPSVAAMLRGLNGETFQLAIDAGEKKGGSDAKDGAAEDMREKRGSGDSNMGGNETGSLPKGNTGDKKASGGGAGGGKGVPSGGDGMPQNVAGQIALVLFLMGLLSLVGGRSNGQEISFQSFVWGLLQKGMVERVEVVNRSVVRVYLKPAAVGSGVPLGVGMRSPGNKYGDSDDMHGRGMDDGDFASRKENQFVISDGNPDHSERNERRANDLEAGSRLTGDSQYYFNIASVDAFERKLNEAQEDMGIPTGDFLPVKYVNETNLTVELLRALPTLLLLGLGVSLMRGAFGSMGGGMGGRGGIFQVGKANPTVVKGGDPTVTKMSFSDVAGLNEAKAEVMEFVDFLKNPKRYEKLGAKIPKGALLAGPPGCGKTLLAKATAGEASVPFFSMSGSDFIEMYVGVGPSRVRDLFAQARAAAPCIVFIDEIDAVGRARGRGGFGGGNDERENTLNALLVEMDGFSSSTGVVVLAGTNRADVLDKALLRPGRFDRQIAIDKPDIRGRYDVFLVHLQPLKLKIAPGSVAKRLAALTPGFSGADIANICNEAALIAAREEKNEVELIDFEQATDRIIGGLEKKNKVISRKEREIVAHHEAGHAIAGWFSKHADPLIKVSIIPRGSAALGFAQYLPVDKFLQSREQMKDFMVMALGGRVAEQLVFGSITTGAQDDLNRITRAVYAQITNYGMSERVGKVNFPRPGEPGAGSQFYKPYSEKTAEMIDEEAMRIVDEAYKSCEALLSTHMDKVKALAERLLEKEVVGEEDLVDVLGERPFSKPVDYDSYVGRFDKDREKRTGKRGEDNGPTAKDGATQPPIPVDGAGAGSEIPGGVGKKSYPPPEEAIPELC